MKENVLLMLMGLLIFISMFACTNMQDKESYDDTSSVFVDVTEEAGLNNKNNDSYAHCWGDINGDGFSDIYVINHVSEPELLLNDGYGSFRNIAKKRGVWRSGDLHGCAIGDYDNDGDQDIYITVGAQSGKGKGLNRLYQNDGSGWFIDVAAKAGVLDPKGRGRSASWIDYNNDGYLDLYIVNKERSDAPSALLENNGNGTFSNVSIESGLDIVDSLREGSWVDYDNDGFMDFTMVKTKRHLKGEIHIYKNLQGGKFEKTKVFDGLTYAWGDYDNDGDPDLFISSPPRVYLWRFEISALSKIIKGFNKLYENTGQGNFIDVSDNAGLNGLMGGERAVFFDYDNDGDLDIYVLVSGTKNKNINDMLFENNGDKTFTDVTKTIGMVQTFNGRGSGVAYADYNNDGFLDVLLTNGRMSYTSGKASMGKFAGPYILYENKGNDNHWLKIKLIGTKSNRDGIGARVKLRYKDKYQYRQNSGGMEGFVQHDKTVHFGLGKATNVDEIEIEWPSGLLTTMTNVKSDQTLILKEISN